jgi:hypothetical protein
MTVNLTSKYEIIDQVESITKEEFEQCYFSKQKPVIIRGGIKDWKAIKLWSPAYFTSLYHNKEVSISIFGEDKLQKYSKKVNMQEAIQLICNNKKKERYYLGTHYSQCDISEEFRELLRDFELPSYAETDKKYTSNLWFGQANHATILHFDFSHNFLAQIMGRKYIRLFSPHDSAYLYPCAPETQMPAHYSQILDIDNVENNLFPKFKYANPLKGTIYPGDIIFIPSGWWHDIRSLDIAISINFWWKPKPKECFMPQILKHLAWNLYDSSLFINIAEYIDFSEYPTDLDIINYLIKMDFRWLAMLFIWNLLEKGIKSSYKKLNYLTRSTQCVESLRENKLLSKTSIELIKSYQPIFLLARTQEDKNIPRRAILEIWEKIQKLYITDTDLLEAKFKLTQCVSNG